MWSLTIVVRSSNGSLVNFPTPAFARPTLSQRPTHRPTNQRASPPPTWFFRTFGLSLVVLFRGCSLTRFLCFGYAFAVSNGLICVSQYVLCARLLCLSLLIDLSMSSLFCYVSLANLVA